MGATENLQKLNTIVARVFAIPESAVTDTASPQTVSSWDSYNALMLVSQIETGFAVTFSMDEVMEVKNIGDMKERLRCHGIEL